MLVKRYCERPISVIEHRCTMGATGALYAYKGFTYALGLKTVFY